ncbi:hypothetical protein [Haloarchaeobius sp. DFWS5]|uniref:hypothetical protein n=1 Tax=Haloarchaeobius sp. DFWS5 TaxID=3446114 RepID=UPI003EBB817A
MTTKTNRIIGVALTLMTLLSGCSTLPYLDGSGQDEPVHLVLENKGNTSHTFKVAVVERPGPIQIFHSDGDVVNRTIGEGTAQTTPSDSIRFEKIEFPNSARQYGIFSLEPDESIERDISNLSSDIAIVVVAYNDRDEIIELVTANCGGLALTDLKILKHSKGSQGVSIAHSCG